MELWTIFLRSLFVYFLVLLVMRIMGKREIGKLSVFDLVVSIMIADFAVLSIEDTRLPLVNGIVPIFTMVFAQILLAYVSLKSPKIRHIVEGEPTVLIRNGKIQEKAMAQQRYTVDDLLTQLREKNIADIADVEFAILETSGKLTVFPKKETAPSQKEDRSQKGTTGMVHLPIPLIIEGRVQEDSLKKIGQNRFWLKNQIQKHGYRDLKEIFFASMDHTGKFYIDPREDQN